LRTLRYSSAGVPAAQIEIAALDGKIVKTFYGLLIGLVLFATTVTAQPQHDRAFWQEIAKNKYAVPEHESADALSQELSPLLASPDPELRDDLAYSILARWIYRGKISTPQMIVLTDEWRGNLKSGIGEVGTNSVLKRSFSTLCLSSMASREAKTPFMGAERYHQLVAESIAYLTAERDLRGYDAKLHWIHSTAHTADLLAALADSSMLTKDEEKAMLSAIAARLATAPEVYTQGEQDRLAAAVVAVIRRSDFQAADFELWVKGIQAEDRDVWTATTPESLARFQNHNYILQALTVRLSIEPDSSRNSEYKQKVLALLKTRLD
jgi:Protein of unknown function (DUF2785)